MKQWLTLFLPCLAPDLTCLCEQSGHWTGSLQFNELSPGRWPKPLAPPNEELHLVGGIVRDALLGRARLADLDFATSARASRALASCSNRRERHSVYLVGERFGTIGAIFGQAPDQLRVEVTTYRRETYPDEHRFPQVAFDATLIDDLARRDFTMNAIAIDARSGEMIDPWGGEADIAQSLVRAVGDPNERFAEDPLRLLRAARFVSQLGFRLDWQTEQAMAAPGSKSGTNQP